MKKINKNEKKKINVFKLNPILTFMFGIVISLTTVYAYDIVASNIGFTPPSGMSSSITNVQSAINEVYAESANYASLSSEVRNIKKKTDKFNYAHIASSDGYLDIYVQRILNHLVFSMKVNKNYSGFSSNENGLIVSVPKELFDTNTYGLFFSNMTPNVTGTNVLIYGSGNGTPYKANYFYLSSESVDGTPIKFVFINPLSLNGSSSYTGSHLAETYSGFEFQFSYIDQNLNYQYDR